MYSKHTFNQASTRPKGWMRRSNDVGVGYCGDGALLYFFEVCDG